jgi:hypothetical protein
MEALARILEDDPENPPALGALNLWVKIEKSVKVGEK